MGTAREDLVALLYEALHNTRKSFGMYGQIGITIEDITLGHLTVRIRTSHEWEGTQISYNVRNAVLQWLREMLPVQRFVAIYDNPTLGIEGEVHDLPYGEALPAADQLGSSVVLVEQNADPAREELRPRFAAAWQRFAQESCDVPPPDETESPRQGEVSR